MRKRHPLSSWIEKSRTEERVENGGDAHWQRVTVVCAWSTCRGARFGASRIMTTDPLVMPVGSCLYRTSCWFCARFCGARG
jgi:hypothetical protein